MKKYNFSLFENKNSYYIETSQLICKALQLAGFYVIWVFSEMCFCTDFKTAFIFSPFQWTDDLASQYINPGHSMNAICTFNLGSVSVG